MIGDYPVHSWKFRAALALIVAVGLIGIVLMLTVGGVIPACADQYPWAQSRRPIDMMSQGWSMSLLQASQQWPRMSL
jgi:hypothetical protein